MNKQFYKMKVNKRKKKKMNQNSMNPQLNKRIIIKIKQIYLKKLITKYNPFKKNNQLNKHKCKMKY